jgi:Ca2+-binding EF-hand superfamily protein
MGDSNTAVNIEAIRKIFAECDTDHNKGLSFDEVFRFLSKKNQERTG